jgi:predicted nucleotidyltransferase
MDFIKGIEGDYIESKSDNLIFDVKGIHHPKERKICFVRFYPDPQGDREKKGQKFSKIYDLKERHAFLKENYPKYLFFSEELDLELQGVKNEDIKKIYTPRDHFNDLQKKGCTCKIEECSRSLCELFINEGNVTEGSIGITGSSMVGLNKDESDIDLIIYGTQTSLEFQDELEKIFNVSNKCRMYNLEEYKSHYEWRVGGSTIPFEDFMKSEKRKLHQGKFHDIDFFIRYIKSPEDWKGSYYDYKYVNHGRIKVKAKVLNSSDSIFTPCTYEINAIEPIEYDKKFKDVKLKEVLEISSFRGRFCEQARNGETVLVEGKLEKVSFKDEFEYYRILLNDQMTDKMIVI